MTINVLCVDTVIENHVKDCTVVIERARGPSYLGERGEPRDFYNLFSVGGKAPLAQGDTAAELQKWAKRRGAKRAEVIR